MPSVDPAIPLNIIAELSSIMTLQKRDSKRCDALWVRCTPCSTAVELISVMEMDIWQSWKCVGCIVKTKLTLLSKHAKTAQPLASANKPIQSSKPVLRGLSFTLIQSFFCISQPVEAGDWGYRKSRRRPFMIPFSLQHLDSGIGSPQAGQPPRGFSGWPSCLNICFNFFMRLCTS